MAVDALAAVYENWVAPEKIIKVNHQLFASDGQSRINHILDECMELRIIKISSKCIFGSTNLINKRNVSRLRSHWCQC